MGTTQGMWIFANIHKHLWHTRWSVFFVVFFLNNFIYKTIAYTTYSVNDTYIVLATYTTYTYTNYAYTTWRYMYYNAININLIYGWRVYKVLFN